MGYPLYNGYAYMTPVNSTGDPRVEYPDEGVFRFVFNSAYPESALTGTSFSHPWGSYFFTGSSKNAASTSVKSASSIKSAYDERTIDVAPVKLQSGYQNGSGYYSSNFTGTLTNYGYYSGGAFVSATSDGNDYKVIANFKPLSDEYHYGTSTINRRSYYVYTNTFSNNSSITAFYGKLNETGASGSLQASSMLANAPRLEYVNFKVSGVTSFNMTWMCHYTPSLKRANIKSDGIVSAVGTFEGASSLEDATIRGSTCKMGGTFANCPSLTAAHIEADNIAFDNGYTSTNARVFENCSALRHVDMYNLSSNPGRMTRMFYHCSSLTSVRLASGDSPYTSLSSLLTHLNQYVTMNTSKQGAFTLCSSFPDYATTKVNSAFSAWF